MRTRARPGRRSAPALLLAAGVLLGSCRARTQPLSSAQFEAIQRELAAQASDVAAQAADASATPAPTPVPPRDDAERRSRAAKALPAGTELGSLAVAGNGTHWVMALVRPKRSDAAVGPNLLLLDVSAPDGVLLAEHDFGQSGSDGEVPARIGRALLLDAASREEPVVLAELLPAEGSKEPLLGACGWWLRRRRVMLSCAPRLTPTSKLDVHEGELVETWLVDPLGGNAAGKAGRTSGRVLRFAEGQWQEVDSFRCLGTPLDQAWKQAGRRPLAAWQADTVRTLTRSATHAARGLETEAAAARLRDALAIDGCAPETWRLLGRLEFEAGKSDAARTLAIALALAPRDDGVLLDLADSLAVLRPEVPAQREAWHDAIAVLGDRPATRPWTEAAAGRSPRAFARTLYEIYLARTSPDDEWLQGRRRRVEEKITALDGVAARR